ncbi:hypothetical protein, partial [Salmonella sp. s51228]|uniref:hypothetical protein n=1 Tax=Salmonella sp. s51228 TaxID=3159652 RepID=UPI003980D5B0
LFLPKVMHFFDACHYLPFVSAIPIKIHDVELCFRASSIKGDYNNFDNMFKAMDELGARIQNAALYGKFPVTLCVEGRIVAGSQCPLAACYSNDTKDLFFYLEILAFQGGDDWDQLSNTFFDIIKKDI